MHGGVPWSNGRPEKLKDFSVNINPLGTPHFIDELLFDALKQGVHRVYPDDYRDLKSLLAEIYDVPPELIGVFNGASQVLSLLPNADVPEPNFSEYRRANSYLASQLDNEFQYRLVGERVITGNPVNPTGSVLGESEILNFLSYGKTLFLDESFVDISPVRGHAKLSAEFGNLLVISSFTKSLAIPGLRFGFTFGKASLELERLAGPWRVNSLIYYVLVNAGAKEIRSFLVRSKEKVIELLSRSNGCGLKTYRSHAPFFLALSPVRSSVLNLRLKRMGFLIRDASDFMGLNDRHVRISLRQDLPELCEAISQALSEAENNLI
jgi:histidinol-phosphate/aromatic aminotransferase/cobyric acid decarboxylase-like protein